MNLETDIDNLTLDVLSTRLKHLVSPLDILRWLGNFKAGEMKMAKDFLANLTVYTTFEIEEALNENFQKIKQGLEKEEIIVVHPIGKFGKSGSMISYFFQKTTFFRDNKKHILLLSSLDELSLQREKLMF